MLAVEKGETLFILQREALMLMEWTFQKHLLKWENK